MDNPTEPQDAAASNAGHRTRRSSFRKSLNDCGLPSGYLDALETKRRTLDESIHKFIASKEREFKQYEKELKHQAKRAEHSNHETSERGTTAVAEVLLQKAGAHGNQHEERRKQEDFPGVFTPEYLTALRHDAASRPTSEPAISRAERGLASDTARSNSDVAAHVDVSRPTRLLLSHRASSSGSSVDGRLISAMKSTASVDMSQPKRKRVSLAVGDTIVAPSDNVPTALLVNSTSSHSRSMTPARERDSLLGDTSESHNSSLTSQFQHQHGQGETINHLQRQGSASAAVLATEAAASARTTDQQENDVGDMFDLEESDDDTADRGTAAGDSEAGYFDSPPESAVLGRVAAGRQPQRESSSGTRLATHSSELLEDDAELQDVPLTPITGIAASKQPADAGFRRPSVQADPVLHGTDYRSALASADAESATVYSSSYSRPTSKGSFTSGSLGESYMARNAEAMMELRAQQREAGQQHRTSHPGTPLPVR